MKKLIGFLFLFLCSFLCFTQEVKQDGAFLHVEKDTLNYGKIKINSDGKRSLKIKNTGNQPLEITYCNGSCGCTVPSCPKRKVSPGDSGQIEIVYDTRKVGKFSKTVTIKSNAINHIIYIKVVGEVLPN